MSHDIKRTRPQPANRHAQAPEVIPKLAVTAVGLTLAALLTAIAATRLTAPAAHQPSAAIASAQVATSGGTPSQSAVNASTVAALRAQGLPARSLSFTDRSDGGIDVVDTATGRTLDTMHGEQGFLRGTLRSFARERKLRHLGRESTLLLTGQGQTLAVADPATGQRIELAAFGHTNAAVFARWIDQEPSTP